MFKLVLFEIRKNYLRRYMIICFLVLMMINAFSIYQNYINGDGDYFLPHNTRTNNQWELYKKMHDQLDGELKSEKIYFVAEEFSRLGEIVNQGTYSTKYQLDTYTGFVFGDYVMITNYFYKPMKYAILYESMVNHIVEKAEENISFYTTYSNNFEKEKNKVISKAYTGRKITIFYDTKPWEKLFTYRFSDFLILCLILLGFVPIFVYERDTKMDVLILSSRKGKLTMTMAKALSIFLFILFLNIVFAIFNYLEIKLLYGLCDSGIPLYSVEAFQNTPLNYSVGEFYYFSIILKIIGLFSFGMLICVCSSVFQYVIYPYMFSVLFLVSGLYVSGYLASVESWKMWVSMLSPFTLMKGEQLCSNLLGCNIANMFFLRVNICISIQAIAIIVLFLLLLLFGTKTDSIIKIRPLRKGGVLNVSSRVL